PVTAAQFALKPVKVLFAAAAAVSVTVAVVGKSKKQVAPQEIPAGVEVTVPVPVPALATVRRAVFAVKVAVTVAAADVAMVQALGLPMTAAQFVLKPEKVLFASGAAVSVTVAVVGKSKKQVA